MTLFKKKQSGYQAWHGWLLLGVVVVALALGFVERVTERNEPPRSEVILNEETCTTAGGTWNACGSACRSLPEGMPCIEVCVPYCECGTSNQCPFGFSCTDYVGLTGICSERS